MSFLRVKYSDLFGCRDCHQNDSRTRRERAYRPAAFLLEFYQHALDLFTRDKYRVFTRYASLLAVMVIYVSERDVR